VIRLQSTVLTLSAVDDLEVTKKEVITVLDQRGLKALSPIVGYNNFKTIERLDIRLFDGNGKEIKSYKIKDFADISATGSNLYDDDRILLLDFMPPEPPFTFEKEVRYTTSTTAFLTPFNPSPNYFVSTEKADYILHNPQEIAINTREFELENFGFKITKTPSKIAYSVSDITVMKPEPFSPYFTSFSPLVKLVPQRFHLGGVTATVNTWDDFAAWQNQTLLSGRDQLNTGTVAKVSSLVAGINDPKERVRAIYRYMQDKTRYISVQVGLGGWQPTPARDVDELNYGDCKGLTNYTMALLSSQGIESYYTIVDSQPNGRDIDEEFVALQGDHVILSVPLEDEMVFLECTNQKLPFNFLGSHTDDRKVVAITPQGAKFLKTHSYPDEENRTELTASISFDPSFTAGGQLVRKTAGLTYEARYRLPEMASNDLKDYYREHWGYLNNLKIDHVQLDNNRMAISFTESIELGFSNYVGKAGSRILLKPNIFSAQPDMVASREKRIRPLEIRRGSVQKDSVTIQLPSGYAVDALFDPIELDSPFGQYRISVTELGSGKLLYKRYFLRRSGRFPANQYRAYIDFLKAVSKADKKKILLKETR